MRCTGLQTMFPAGHKVPDTALSGDIFRLAGVKGENCARLPAANILQARAVLIPFFCRGSYPVKAE